MRLLSISLLGLALISGCGAKSDAPTLAPASGTVLFKGDPLPGATVTMLNDKGQLVTAVTDSLGNFVMKTNGVSGAPLGKYKVGITKFAAVSTEMKTMKPEDMRSMQMSAKSAGATAPKSEIPEKYGDPNKSELEAVVDKDGSKNVYKFTLFE